MDVEQTEGRKPGEMTERERESSVAMMGGGRSQEQE